MVVTVRFIPCKLDSHRSRSVSVDNEHESVDESDGRSDVSDEADVLPGSISAWQVVNNKKKKRKEISPVAGDQIRKQTKRKSKRGRKSAEPYQHIP
jgi:hypothetical protein